MQSVEPSHECAGTDEACPLPDDEVRIVPPRVRLWPWAAALASAGLPFRIVDAEAAGERALAVPRAAAEAVRQELAEYERANREWPYGLHRGVELEPMSPVSLMVALVVSLGLVRFYFLTGPAAPGSVGFAVGALQGDSVRAGEWWRVVTSLTLHADAGHVLGNAVFIGVLGGAVAQFLGSGVGWLLILLSGVFGNLLSAFVQEPRSAAVGASTAAFGAQGIMAALQAVRAWRRMGHAGLALSRSWLPLIAATGLLAFLGTGRGADLGAHALGFACGLVLGGVSAYVFRAPPRGWSQAFAGCLGVALIVLAWRLALSTL